MWSSASSRFSMKEGQLEGVQQGNCKAYVVKDTTAVARVNQCQDAMSALHSLMISGTRGLLHGP